LKEEHLLRHWLGKDRDGLLYRLMKMPARFSLVHGDLHPRNVLADEANVWLIDFGQTGVAPSLFDFAKLEVYLRLWCLPLAGESESVSEAAVELETRLLDHITGAERGLDSVPATARDLGAAAGDLLKVIRCILEIRRHALVYSLGSPDRCDYLAVLYLTVISTLRYAGKERLPANYRWIVGLAWVLEEALSGIMGVPPFPRRRAAQDPKQFLAREWLAAPGAPGRVRYFLEREDGRKALAALSATRGVLQNPSHHLDVLDHSLLVLAYLEALLADQPGYPLRAFLDPGQLDRQVEQDLRGQGLVFPAVPRPSPSGSPRLDGEAAAAWQNEVQSHLIQLLDPDSRVLLKWVALFHDVGKPATRSMDAGIDGARGKIQFLGHEVFGRRLVSDHLRLLFPDDRVRQRAEVLIDKHHLHHALATQYLKDATQIDMFREAVARGGPPPAGLRSLCRDWNEHHNPHAGEFPLLLLHGFADILACRGPEADSPLPRVAELDLLLLALYFRHRKTKDAHEIEERSKQLVKGLGSVIGVKEGPALGAVVKAVTGWCLEELGRRANLGLNGPTREDVIEKAREILQQMEQR
jgi:hypothetical protein